MDPAARRFAGDVTRTRVGGLRLRPGRGRACNLSVERHCGFKGDKRQACANVLGKALVEPPRLGLEDSNLDFDSGGTKFFETFSGNLGIGIFHAADDARDSSGDDRVGAGSGASSVRAGLQIEVESVAARRRPRLLNGQYLGVLPVGIDVAAAADNAPALVHDHRAHHGIGRGQSQAALGQLDGLLEEQLVGLDRHGLSK